MLRRYCAPLCAEVPIVDGRFEKPFWEDVPWSEPFVDIADGRAPWFQTRMKMAWGEWGLAVVADLQEPHLWATYSEHDSVIFHENDFELFLDPDGDGLLYGELEINALNTTWDLLLTQRYLDGGVPINSWEIKGLQTAVELRGTLNDPSDKDDGWSVEILMPWTSWSEIARGIACPPTVGDTWRINFSRVQWDLEVVEGKYQKTPGRNEHNWVWQRQGEINMHLPDRWGWLEFGG